MRFTFKGIYHLRNGYFVVLLLMCFLTPLAAVLTSNAMGQLTEHVSESGIKGAGRIAAVTCGLYLVEVIISYIFTYCRGRINGDVYAAVQNGIQKHIFFGGLNDAGKYDINLYNSVSNDADEVCRFSSETFPNILLQTVNLIVIMTYMLIINWKISVVYFAAVILSVGTQMIISRAVNRTGEEIKSCESKLNEKLADILRNRIIIKCYESEEFAGTLYQDRDILVIDEPTSALDPERSEILKQKLESIPKERTVIAVTHRLNLTQNFDCIYVVKNGKIVEAGSHNHLKSTGKIYSGMWELQQAKDEM